MVPSICPAKAGTGAQEGEWPSQWPHTTYPSWNTVFRNSNSNNNNNNNAQGPGARIPA